MIKKFTPSYKKKSYLTPEVVAVSVVVEQGYQTSHLIPAPELETWDDANSSGANFWGDANISIGSTENYSNFEWGW